MTTRTDSPHGVKITGVGSVNGESFKAEGRGHGDPTVGKWDFAVTFSVVPRDVDPIANLLGILILPTVVFGRTSGDATNLLTIADGVLEFTQILRGNDTAVQSVGTIRRTAPGELHWDSEATGVIHIPKLAEIEPFDAVTLPQGRGKLMDVFALPFLDGARARHVVQVVREITFTPKAELKQIQFRHITIESTVKGRTVEVRTRSIIRTIDAPFRLAEQVR